MLVTKAGMQPMTFRVKALGGKRFADDIFRKEAECLYLSQSSSLPITRLSD